MKPISITGMGSYLPRRMLTNDDLPALDKPYPPEVIARLGVRQRGWAGEGEGIPEMACEAAQRALDASGWSASDLDFIVLASWTQRQYLPDWAARLQALLVAPQAFAFDISTSCAGFAYGLGVAQGLLQLPRHRRGLVVASETTSHRARPHSKATVVFGDAAGAWVVEADAQRGGTLIDLELMTDGTQFGAMDINDDGYVRTHIAQKELQQLAMHSFKTASAAVLERQSLTLADVDWVVPHSGTAGIQALLLESLEVSPDKVLVNFPTVGNVSSAAIPVALDAFVQQGVIKKGDLVLSPTTGAGWYAAALLYRV